MHNRYLEEQRVTEDIIKSSGGAPCVDYVFFVLYAFRVEFDFILLYALCVETDGAVGSVIVSFTVCAEKSDLDLYCDGALDSYAVPALFKTTS